MTKQPFVVPRANEPGRYHVHDRTKREGDYCGYVEKWEFGWKAVNAHDIYRGNFASRTRAARTLYEENLTGQPKPDVPRLDDRDKFRAFAKENDLGSFHEPDEVNITARVEGVSFDNAGFWPGNKLVGTEAQVIRELHVVFSRTDDDGKPVEDLAAVNLADLCNWANT